jgi:RNA polymerase sigma-70 factor, ECF subfamily
LYLADAAHRSSVEGATPPPRQQQLEIEGRLVEAARSSPGAFGELYERYVDAIYRYVYQRVGDKMLAEDLVAETFHRALEHMQGYEWRGIAFSSWLYRIASNVIAAHFRAEPRMGGEEALEQAAELAPGPEQVLTRMERRAELLAVVQALPADQQQVIVLRFGQELRNKEIGRIMHRSEGAVKALLHRALSTLHRRLAAGEGARGALPSATPLTGWK